MIAVDLFSGAGGFSAGASQANVEVIWAANHWPLAVHYHAANFPKADHVCQDLNTFPSCDIPDHDILLASPSCKGFSPARGKHQKLHDRHRATAWIVVDVLEAKRPNFAVIENVPEMMKWILYPSWRQALKLLGYKVEELIVDAADHGVPQNRVRLFIIATKGNRKVPMNFEATEHKPVGSVLDWQAGNWSDIYKPGRSAKTIARIETARRQGFEGRFLIPYYGSGSGMTGRSIDRPIGTLTTKARWALVDSDKSIMRMLAIEEARSIMGFEPDYILPSNTADANAVLGNAVCPPVVSDILKEIRRAA